jgi:hypothetical protein
MAQSGFEGPFALTDDIIDREVAPGCPGAYVLEDSVDLVNFEVVYAGKSDCDVNNQLHVHVGAYKRFRFQICPSSQAAFEMQCSFYHQFSPRDNPVHPQPSPGAEWKCPSCGVVG